MEKLKILKQFYSTFKDSGLTQIKLFSLRISGLLQNLQMCRREDLNLQGLLHTVLSRARIPIPPLRHIHKYSRVILQQITNFCELTIFACAHANASQQIKAILDLDLFMMEQ